MQAPRVSNVTLPLGGDYLITRHEADALSTYLEAHDADKYKAFRVWRASDGNLYLQAERGRLIGLTEAVSS